MFWLCPGIVPGHVYTTFFSAAVYISNMSRDKLRKVPGLVNKKHILVYNLLHIPKYIDLNKIELVILGKAHCYRKISDLTVKCCKIFTFSCPTTS